MSPDEEVPTPADDDAASPPSSTGARPKSTIKFPYVALDEVSTIAETMFNTYSGRCSSLQLASALKQKETSGSFRVKVTAAKMFGVVGGRGDGLVLTPLGNALVDPKRRRKARVDAFLNIPLYAALYEGAQQRSGMMPENLRTIEQEIIRLGVVENQAETARLAFTRSARFAGFLEHGKDRLIMPALNDVPDEDDQEHDDEGDLGNGGGEVSLPGKPTILVEVFKMLPGEGEPFEPGARRDWQRLLTATLDMLYQDSKGPDGGSER